MKSIIIWVIIIIGELSGMYLIYAGFKRKIQGVPSFRVMHFFHNLPAREHSGVQLIIEGFVVIVSGALLYYAFFVSYSKTVVKLIFNFRTRELCENNLIL